MPFSALRNRDFRKRHLSETGWLESSVPLWKADAPCNVLLRTTPRWSLRPPSETPASCAALPNSLRSVSVQGPSRCVGLWEPPGRDHRTQTLRATERRREGRREQRHRRPTGRANSSRAARRRCTAHCCVLRGCLRTALGRSAHPVWATGTS